MLQDLSTFAAQSHPHLATPRPPEPRLDRDRWAAADLDGLTRFAITIRQPLARSLGLPMRITGNTVSVADPS